MNITVVGLGKIGLPLAVQYASKGFKVFGADVNRPTVELVNAGIEPFPGEEGLADALVKVVREGKLIASTDTAECVRQSDVVVVAVPLLVDSVGQPDFRLMDSATTDIGRGLQEGVLVSFETTLPVGTTRSRFVPTLQSISGLTASSDFFVVFSPERVLTGRVFRDLRRYPKLVGGVDSRSEERGVEFYEAVLDFDDRLDLHQRNGVWRMGSAEAAEFAKLAETTYRDVNIALANEFAMWAESNGIDFHRVIEASNSQPFSHIHRPGVAVGGHCIPVYPRLYLWNDPAATVVRAAREANEAMPEHVAGLVEHMHGDLSDVAVAILGAAYRGGVKETAFSGVFPLVHALTRRGAECLVHDPLYSDDELLALGLRPYHLGEPVSAAVVQADHDLYGDLGPSDLPGLVTLVDGRNCTTPDNWPGVRYHRLGDGEAR